MKDIEYLGDKKYYTQLTAEQLEWLKKDLSYVKTGTTVFLNVHAPIFNIANSKQVLDVLKDYNVHIFPAIRIFIKMRFWRKIFTSIMWGQYVDSTGREMRVDVEPRMDL